MADNPMTTALKKDLLRFTRQYVERLRDEIECHEISMKWSGMLGGMFGDPGGRDSSEMMSHRKSWAVDLASLHEIEEALGTLNDEWWTGPHDEEPPMSANDIKGIAFMMEGLRVGEDQARRHISNRWKEWDKKRKSKRRWTRFKEAEAQRANPKRRLKISRSR